MNFCGIVCEFNPFHNGHEYIIQEAKKLTNKEIICLMSGDFVQRGTPAIQSKYDRAKNAILAGANAVLELPCVYACSNAENFAFGAVKTFKALGINTIAFGIENTDLETLKKVAKLKFENSERFKDAFKNEVQNGINYNTALKRSIAETLGDDGIIEILNKPNNILGVEYLTAILKLDANIEVVAIERTDNGYNSKTNKSKFLSASSIRERILNGENYKEFVPAYAKINSYFTAIHNNIFNSICLLKIRQTPAQKVADCYDYSEGIEFRIKKIADTFSNLDEIIEKVSTPRYRKPRVNKLVVYPLLNITKKIQASAKALYTIV